MATFQTKGLDAYIRRLEELTSATDEQFEAVVNAGANVLADAVRAALNAIPTHDDNAYGTPKHPISGLSAREKADLIRGYGVAPIRNDEGYINRKIGFHGYGSRPTKKYPNGVPIPLLARSLESGTSWRQKSPVIRQAVNRAKKSALEAMQREFEVQISKTMRGE